MDHLDQVSSISILLVILKCIGRNPISNVQVTYRSGFHLGPKYKSDEFLVKEDNDEEVESISHEKELTG